MQLTFDRGLITTTVTINYQGKILRIDDVIVDTGSSHTIFSPDILEEIGIRYENSDPVYESYGIGGIIDFYVKKIDEIEIGDLKLQNIEIDVGMLPKDHKGLVGLDILKEYKYIVDLDSMGLYRR